MKERESFSLELDNNTNARFLPQLSQFTTTNTEKPAYLHHIQNSNQIASQIQGQQYRDPKFLQSCQNQMIAEENRSPQKYPYSSLQMNQSAPQTPSCGGHHVYGPEHFAQILQTQTPRNSQREPANYTSPQHQPYNSIPGSRISRQGTQISAQSYVPQLPLPILKSQSANTSFDGNQHGNHAMPQQSNRSQLSMFSSLIQNKQMLGASSLIQPTPIQHLQFNNKNHDILNFNGSFQDFGQLPHTETQTDDMNEMHINNFQNLVTDRSSQYEQHSYNPKSQGYQIANPNFLHNNCQPDKTSLQGSISNQQMQMIAQMIEHQNYKHEKQLAEQQNMINQLLSIHMNSSRSNFQQTAPQMDNMPSTLIPPQAYAQPPQPQSHLPTSCLFSPTVSPRLSHGVAKKIHQAEQNPNLPRISANVHEYRRLVQNYFSQKQNSHTLQTTNNTASPQQPPYIGSYVGNYSISANTRNTAPQLQKTTSYQTLNQTPQVVEDGSASPSLLQDRQYSRQDESSGYQTFPNRGNKTEIEHIINWPSSGRSKNVNNSLSNRNSVKSESGGRPEYHQSDEAAEEISQTLAGSMCSPSRNKSYKHDIQKSTQSRGKSEIQSNRDENEFSDTVKQMESQQHWENQNDQDEIQWTSKSNTNQEVDRIVTDEEKKSPVATYHDNEDQALKNQNNICREDAQILPKVDQTFEQLLESKLSMINEGIVQTNIDQTDNSEDLINQQSMKVATKKFLKRGSNQKYDPLKARKQQSLTEMTPVKKYSYYADRFQKKDSSKHIEDFTNEATNLNCSENDKTKLEVPLNEKEHAIKADEELRDIGSPVNYRDVEKQQKSIIEIPPATKQQSKTPDRNIKQKLEILNRNKSPLNSRSKLLKEPPVENESSQKIKVREFLRKGENRTACSSRLRFNMNNSQSTKTLQKGDERPLAKQPKRKQPLDTGLNSQLKPLNSSRNTDGINKINLKKNSQSRDRVKEKQIVSGCEKEEDVNERIPDKASNDSIVSAASTHKQLKQSDSKIHKEYDKVYEDSKAPQFTTTDEEGEQSEDNFKQVKDQTRSGETGQNLKVLAKRNHSRQMIGESSIPNSYSEQDIHDNSILEFEKLEKECCQQELRFEDQGLFTNAQNTKFTLIDEQNQALKFRQPVPQQSIKKQRLNHGSPKQRSPQNQSTNKPEMQETFETPNMSLFCEEIIQLNEKAKKSPLKETAGNLLSEFKDQLALHQTQLLKSGEGPSLQDLVDVDIDQSSLVDKFEEKLLALISEQEIEVAKLRTENERVDQLKKECERQLEKFTKDHADHERIKAQNQMLKDQIRVKDKEVIRLQGLQIDQEEKISQLHSINQDLNRHIAEISNKCMFSQTTQTEVQQVKTRNVMVNTPLWPKNNVDLVEQAIQVQIEQRADPSIPSIRLVPKQTKSVTFKLDDEDHSVDSSLLQSQHPIQLNLQKSCSELDGRHDEEEVKYGQQNDENDVGRKFNNNNNKGEKEEEEEDVNNGSVESQNSQEFMSETSEVFDLIFPEEYHSDELNSELLLIEETQNQEGKISKRYSNGKREIVFPNGVKREVWPDGYQVVFFINKDIKQTFKDGKIVYFFADAKTTQTTFPGGLQVFKFHNNQIEKHYPDGVKEISFPDGTNKCLFADGEEESIFPDGTIQRIEKSGLRTIEYPSGQRDVMHPDGTKLREYPDGSVKKYNLDGSVEQIVKKPE